MLALPPPIAAPMSAPFLPPMMPPIPAPAPVDPPITSAVFCHERPLSLRDAVREAVDQLAAEGIKLDYMRIRAFPFGPEVDEFLLSHEANFIVDQNRDGQLKSLLTLETSAPKEKLVSVRYFGGMPLSASHVVERVKASGAVEVQGATL